MNQSFAPRVASYGSAARCAARLCLAGDWKTTSGSARGTAFGPETCWAKPEPRAKPIDFIQTTARQSLAAHQAAKPFRNS